MSYSFGGHHYHHHTSSSSSFLACNSRLHSTVRRPRHPQRPVLSHINCFRQCEIMGSQILLYGVQPCDAGASSRCPPVLWRESWQFLWWTLLNTAFTRDSRCVKCSSVGSLTDRMWNYFAAGSTIVKSSTTKTPHSSDHSSTTASAASNAEADYGMAIGLVVGIGTPILLILIIVIIVIACRICRSVVRFIPRGSSYQNLFL